MNFNGSCEDRLAIRDLLDTFADAQTREDEELWASCWVDDAVWVTTQGEHRGKDKILAAWLAWNEAYHRARGLCRVTLNQAASIRVEGERASGRSYFSVATFSEDTDGPHLFYGMYRDEFLKQGGIWRFQRRVYESIAKLRTGVSPVAPKGAGRV